MGRPSRQLVVGGRVSFPASALGMRRARERFGNEYRTQRLFGMIRHCCSDDLAGNFRISIESGGDDVILSGGQLRVERTDERLLPPPQPHTVAPATPADGGSDDDTLTDDTNESDEDQDDEEREAEPSDGAAAAQPVWQRSDVTIDRRRAAGLMDIRAALLPQGATRATPYDYWQHFLPSEYLRDSVVPRTNACGAAGAGAAWAPLNLEELQVWLALWAVMTLSPRGSRELYWRTPDEDFLPIAPAFGRYMSHRRFEAILDNVQLGAAYHVTDAHVAEDPLFCVREMFAAVNDHMMHAYQPSSRLCIDESMEALRGSVDRMPGRRKIARKPKGVGMEIRDIADCQMHILLRMEPCEPHAREIRKQHSVRLGITTGSMVRLTEPWHSSGRIVFGDSLFGSPRACAAMADVGLYSVLMIKRRRYWPVDVPSTIISDVPDAFNSAQAFERTCRGHSMYIAVFKDRKPRVIVANTLTMRRTEEVHRIVKNAQGLSAEVPLHPPEVFAEYSRSKSAVDAANSVRESMSSFSDTLITREWRLKIFGFLVGVLEGNAFLAHGEFNRGARMQHYDFRYQVSRSILLQYRPPLLDAPQRLAAGRARLHELQSFTRSLPKRRRANGSRKYLQRNCVICHARSSTHCACDNTRGLCVHCFPTHYRDLMDE